MSGSLRGAWIQDAPSSGQQPFGSTGEELAWPKVGSPLPWSWYSLSGAWVLEPKAQGCNPLVLLSWMSWQGPAGPW